MWHKSEEKTSEKISLMTDETPIYQQLISRVVSENPISGARYVIRGRRAASSHPTTIKVELNLMMMTTNKRKLKIIF